MERVTVIYKGKRKNMDFCGKCLEDMVGYMKTGKCDDIGENVENGKKLPVPGSGDGIDFMGGD